MFLRNTKVLCNKYQLKYNKQFKITHILNKRDLLEVFKWNTSVWFCKHVQCHDIIFQRTKYERPI